MNPICRFSFPFAPTLPMMLLRTALDSRAAGNYFWTGCILLSCTLSTLRDCLLRLPPLLQSTFPESDARVHVEWTRRLPSRGGWRVWQTSINYTTGYCVNWMWNGSTREQQESRFLPILPTVQVQLKSPESAPSCFRCGRIQSTTDRRLITHIFPIFPAARAGNSLRRFSLAPRCGDFFSLSC